jgi:hypothetical protein
MTALLACGPMLEDPRLREAIGRIDNPRWFEQIERFVIDLPTAVRSYLPQWACVAGLSSTQRSALLARWMQLGCPQLRRHCIFAMGHLRTPDIPGRFKELAAQEGDLAQFTRWWLAGSGQRHADAAPAEASTVQPPRDAASEFNLLWEVCTRSSGTERRTLISLLQRHFSLWRTAIMHKLAAPVAEQRLLALAVVSDLDLALQCTTAVQRLIGDKDPRIRDQARVIMRGVAQRRVAADFSTRVGQWQNVGQYRPLAVVRDDLNATLMDLLSQSAAGPAPREMIETLELLLEEYHGAREAADQQLLDARGGGR